MEYVFRTIYTVYINNAILTVLGLVLRLWLRWAL